ncbi:MAG: dienelactone hydrolase family protein [Proteobacteria bacterium]|nr:dienelactone hydrolase family protein [Pseudomonadota bacterium]MBU6424753.1 dienelactone hydrolase family protein [Rhodospirillales bacterium]
MMMLTAADGHKLQAFEAGNVNAPRGLVVVQEIFGVNAHIRNVAERLAGFGYRVMAPAMFDRVSPGIELDYSAEGVEAGKNTRAKIPEDKALLDLEAAAAAFAGRPVGIIGYCWGGSLAWDAAIGGKRFKAASCWYGAGIAAKKDAKPNCPVQMHFGAEDHGIPMSDVEAIKAAQPGVEVFVYAGAQHGFGCEARASYSQKDWELAELRSMAFFAEHLR